jgi:Uma2 family endonuclease
VTIDDFERLTDEQAHNRELVDGELVPTLANTLEQNLIRDLLIVLLRPFVRERGLGFVVGEQDYDFHGNAHGPDVSLFGPAKLPLVDPDKRVQRFVPDLAIEVVSGDEIFTSVWGKKERYLRCGTAEVWIVYPVAREVFVYAATGDRILREGAELTSELLPDFRLPVTRLFDSVSAS